MTGHTARRALRAVVFGCRNGMTRIHSPRFWRAFYAILASRRAARFLALLCKSIARTTRSLGPEDIALRLSHLFLVGWPHHMGTPWINLDVSRGYWRVVRELRGDSARPLRPLTRGHILRIGVVANLGGSLIFPRELFEATPDGVEVHAFDICADERDCGVYLRSLVPSYDRIDPGAPETIAQRIRDADLDLVLLDIYKSDVYRILDGLDTPCIVNLSTTVNLRFHSSVAFHLYFLEQADYLIRNDRIFRGTSRSWFSDHVVFTAFQPFDLRGLDPTQRLCWADREPLLVYHGKLYKASEAYLHCVFGLLRDDPELQFVAMGRDDGIALERIRTSAREFGVEERVHYEGEFRAIRNPEGRLNHPSWLALVELLGKARLAPDPWPLAGGCSRFEAYAAGAPVAHMGIRNDPEIWGRPQPAVTADQPALAVTLGTAYSIDQYVSLCQKALYDAPFADALAHEQASLASRLADPSAFWRQLLDCYERWKNAA